MRIILLLATVFFATHAGAYESTTTSADTSFVKHYTDSLASLKHQYDSLSALNARLAALNQKYSKLFLPVTFYGEVTDEALALNKQLSDVNAQLLKVYLKRPDLVHGVDSDFIDALPVVEKPQRVETELVEKVAPVAEEMEVAPVNVFITKPNFWTIKGDYFLQLIQNYVSSNWYKGGESNYSAVGSVTMEANYRNKQRVTWDNKLELKLGFQSSRGDTVHSYKTSEDLIRYTSKLGLQATKRWYYTLQLQAYTQFTRGYKSNDRFVYSNFLSPLNLNLSVGMDYKVEWLKKRLTGNIHLAPLAGNFRYVELLALSTRYGLDEGKHTLWDYGSQFTADLEWKISENIKWKSRLYGYTTYKRAEVEWENTFAFQLSKYISTNLFVYPRFDDGASRDDRKGYWQLKEYMSIGFAYSF